MKIWDKSQIKRRFFLREIRSSVKKTLSLFKYLEKKLQKREITIEEINDKELKLFTKIRRRRVNVEITDTERENLLEIDVYRPRKSYFGGIYNWSNKQIFGLRYSLWVVLLIIAVSIVPLIILLAVKESIPQEAQDALRIGGVVLVSIGGSVLLLYLLSTRISLGRNEKLYDEVTDFTQEIIDLIEVYKEEIKDKIACWNCFKEINAEIQKCPHCGTNL